MKIWPLLPLLLLAAPARAQDAPAEPPAAPAAEAPAAPAPDVAALQAKLEALQARLNRAGGRDFATSRRIHVDIDSRVITTWFNAVAGNGLRSVATGTRFEGQLVDTSLPVLGPVRAQLNPASGTRLEVTLRNPRVSTGIDQLTLTGDMTATARAQARFQVNGVNQRATCRTPSPVRERATATFQLGTPTRSRYPFTLSLTRPVGLRAALNCDIAGMRQIDNALPIDGLAGTLARGNINIGLSETLRLPAPGNGAPLAITITPVRPSLRVTERGISFSAD
jgi:hypothetical protein